MKRSSRELVIALHLIPGIGGRRLWQLIHEFGGAQGAWDSSKEQLQRLPGFGAKLVDQVVAGRSRVDPVRELEWATANGISVTTFQDSDYPQVLKELAVPPPVLYYRGRLPEHPGVAVVGTRKPSSIGKRQAFAFAQGIAQAGVPVVSGLARGVDGEAHRGALACGGETIAVLGSPLDRIYPSEHQALGEEIAASGCLISEFSSKMRTVPGNFPQRNRLLSGLSYGVLVVEAPRKSGALITADWALEQGKEVWAIPGEIHHHLRRGNHWLIKQGAALVESVEDIVSYDVPSLKNDQYSLDPQLQSVFQFYRQGYSVDQIQEMTGFSISTVQSCLAMLKVDGIISE